MKKYLLPSALILAFGLTLALAQNITKSIQLSQSAGGPIGVDANNNTYFPGHILSVGKTPTVSDGTVVGTDYQGKITESSNSIGGTLTFSQAFLVAPACVLVSEAPGVALATPIAFSTVTTSLTYSHLSQVSKILDYICSGSS